MLAKRSNALSSTYFRMTTQSPQRLLNRDQERSPLHLSQHPRVYRTPERSWRPEVMDRIHQQTQLPHRHQAGLGCQTCKFPFRMRTIRAGQSPFRNLCLPSAPRQIILPVITHMTGETVKISHRSVVIKNIPCSPVYMFISNVRTLE